MPEASGQDVVGIRQRDLNRLKRALFIAEGADPAIAEEIARLALADARRLTPNSFSYYSKANCLVCLGRSLHLLKGEQGEIVFAFLLDQVRDMELCYMATSGVRSPYLHYGINGLSRAVPHLSGQRLAAARDAVATLRIKFTATIKKGPGRQLDNGPKDLESMFSAIEEALARQEK